VSAVSPAGEVLITFPNRYSRLESEAALLPILGERTTTFFRQAFALEIDGDKLPAENAQELLEELQRLYALLQQSVDESLQQPGFRPGPNGNGNSHNQSWGCSEKQRGLILRLVQEHQLDKALVEQLSQDRFGKSLKSLTRLEASSLIEALIDKTGGSTKNQRRRFNDRGNPANAR